MYLQKVRTGMLTALVVGLGVLGLAGCGGDTPTATPVAAPTATTAVMEEPTATTGTMEEPTEVMEEPTATTEVMEEPTATTGTGSMGGGEALDLLTKSGKAMADVKTYHMSIKSETAGVASTIEADVEMPDKYRMTTEASGVSTEIILIGDASYTRMPGSDQYLESVGQASMIPKPEQADLSGITDAEIVGDETLDGKSVTHIHYTASGDAAGAPGTSVDTDIWIDKSTNYIHQIEVKTDVSGTTTSSTITYSKHNEPISPPIEKPTNIMTLP